MKRIAVLMLVLMLLVGGVLIVEAARSALSVQSVTRSALTAAYTQIPTDGYKFTNDGATILHLKNSSGSTKYITVTTPLTVDGLAVSDLTLTITSTSEVFLGPFPTTTYNQQSGSDKNMVYLNVDTTDASMTVAALTF